MYCGILCLASCCSYHRRVKPKQLSEANVVWLYGEDRLKGFDLDYVDKLLITSLSWPSTQYCRIKRYASHCICLFPRIHWLCVRFITSPVSNWRVLLTKWNATEKKKRINLYAQDTTAFHPPVFLAAIDQNWSINIRTGWLSPKIQLPRSVSYSLLDYIIPRVGGGVILLIMRTMGYCGVMNERTIWWAWR